MAVKPVPPMTDVPSFPALSDRAAGTYNGKAFDFATHMADNFNSELIAVAQSVLHNAGEAIEKAATAEFAARASAASMDAAIAVVGAPLWTRGVHTPKGRSVIGPVDGHTYRKLTDVATTEDPAMDKTNWVDLTAANKNEAESASAAASTARAGAEAARDAAQLSAGIYRDIPAGLAATASGRFFSVPAGDGKDSMIMYRNNSGTAVEVSRYPAAAEVRAIGERISKKLPDVNLVAASEDLLVSIVDSDMRRTWLEARAADGGPSEHAQTHVRRAARLDDEHVHQGILAGVMDSEGRLTDLVVRDSDGQVPEWVIARWAPRIAEALRNQALSRVTVVESYTPGSDLQPLYPTMTTMAGWGSSSMEGIQAEITNMAVSFGVTNYFNGGRGGEWSTDSCARMGSIPAVLKIAGGSIPASGPVAVTCTNTTLTTALLPYAGTINGVHGTLMVGGGGHTFTRSVAGNAVQMEGEYSMIPDKGMENRASVVLLWLGKNDLSSGIPAAEVIARTDHSFEWLAPMVKRCLVIGQFVNGGTPVSSQVRENIYAVNAQQKARYGQFFIDVHELITSPNVWVATGITPTQADLNEQAIGNKPPSLSTDPGHFNSAGYALVRRAIEARMKALKWYV
ncbi:SGNH/GDSL hydrolase family protein [Massilia timonae]|uniref:SGNH/GDSL hydrolase family protein n=1 Tax=Massilia timonae TaxID=47229 RepID=UPI0028D49FE8|nr:SGNH/GDSL hydrolase family protein [Massilia timonae]